MKKALIKEGFRLYHYLNGEKIEGKNQYMTGDGSGLIGNCSRLSGDCSGLIGYCSGVSGNIDDCYITVEDREKGVNIIDLIKDEE